MTPEERKRVALAEVVEALNKYGCELSTQWNVEQLGTVLQARPQIIVVAKTDWQPKDTATENASTIVDSDNHNTNG